MYGMNVHQVEKIVYDRSAWNAFVWEDSSQSKNICQSIPLKESEH